MKKLVDPKRWPFFYGYWIVVCTIVGVGASAPGQTIGVSVFTDSLIESLDISRLALSTAYMVGTIASSLFITRLGGVIDRRGARWVATLSAVGLGVTLLILSQIDRVAVGLDAALGIDRPAAVAFAVIAFAFAWMRFFGQGALTLASRTMLMQWFRLKRGRMNAIAGVATALVFAGSPWVFEQLIQAHGWRGAWWILAVTSGVGMSVFAALFFRDRPEAHNLLPDGVNSFESTQAIHSEVATEDNWTLTEAKTTYTFWLFNLAMALLAFHGTAVMFHIVSIFELAGRGREQAVSIFLPAATIAVVMNIVGGYLADRFEPLKYHLMALLFGVLCSSTGILLLDDPIGRVLVICGHGVSSGMFSTLVSLAWPRFFGRLHLGALSGFNMAWLVFASAIGPFLFGLSQDATGGYTAAIALSMTLAAVLVMLATRGDQPVRVS